MKKPDLPGLNSGHYISPTSQYGAKAGSPGSELTGGATRPGLMRPGSKSLKPGQISSPITGQLEKTNQLDMGKLDLLTGSLSAIPMIRSGDSIMAGGTKIAMGLAAKTQIAKAFPSLGAKSLGALGALGGGLAISGIADLATTLLPNFAAIPASAFGGYVVGTSAFTSLGLSSGVAGFVGAGLGLGFGIYGVINNRRKKEAAQREEANWLSERVEEISGVIGQYSKNIPLIDDEMSRLDEQYKTNLNIIALNQSENLRFNFQTTEAVKKQSRKMIGNLNVQLSQAGFSQEGLGWFMKGEVEDQQIKALDDENWRFQTEGWKMELQRRKLFGDYKSAQAGLLYARYSVENELDYAQRLLSKNMAKLGSNPMASYEQKARASAGVAFASGLKNQLGEGTKRLERSYYG
jgi:hypothetical protein